MLHNLLARPDAMQYEIVDCSVAQKHACITSGRGDVTRTGATAIGQLVGVLALIHPLTFSEEVVGPHLSLPRQLC